MVYLPIELDVDGASVLVVGGGLVGERKARRLLAYGAKVCLAAPEVSPGLAELIGQGLIERRLSWVDIPLGEFFLVVAAASDAAANDQVARQARQAGCLVVSASNPGLGNAVFPAVVRRGLFSLAVSTNGASPALAAKVKKDLGGHYGRDYEVMAELMARLRPLVLAAGKASADNARLFRRIIDSEQLWILIKRSSFQEALNLLREMVHPLDLGPDFRFW